MDAWVDGWITDNEQTGWRTEKLQGSHPTPRLLQLQVGRDEASVTRCFWDWAAGGKERCVLKISTQGAHLRTWRWMVIGLRKEEVQHGS